MSGVTQPALPGEFGTMHAMERVSTWSIRDDARGRLHFVNLISGREIGTDSRTYCGYFRLSHEVLATWENQRICKSCYRVLVSRLRRLKLPRAIFDALYQDEDFRDEVAQLARADFLERSPNEHDQNIAEAIRCYWEIKSDDVSVPRKLALLKRMREVLK